jgi:hypothetical protein
MVPLVAVNGPLPIAYSLPAAPKIETDVGASIPVIATAFDVQAALVGALVTGVKLNGSGVVSTTSDAVVHVKFALTPPMVTVDVVELFAVRDVVCRTTMLWLLVIDPVVAKAPPLTDISEPLVPVTVAGAAALIPVIACASDVHVAFVGCPDFEAKLNGSGVVSTAALTMTVLTGLVTSMDGTAVATVRQSA